MSFLNDDPAAEDRLEEWAADRQKTIRFEKFKEVFFDWFLYLILFAMFVGLTFWFVVELAK